MEEQSYLLLIETLKSLGTPGAVFLAVGYALRKMWMWAKPHVEDMIKAYVKRQESMAHQNERLVTGTLDIQNQVLAAVQGHTKQLPTVCRWNPATKKPRTPRKKAAA